MRKPAECHPEKPTHAHGLCKDCYDKNRALTRKVRREQMRPFDFRQQRLRTFDPGEVLPLNTYDTAVTDYAVRCMLACQMDLTKAIDMMSPDASPQLKGKILDQLNTDIRFKTALQRDLTKRGLDDHSKERYVEEVWRMFLNDADPRLKAAAMRVLGKAFIAEKIESRHIEDLPIADFNEGVKLLLAEAEDPNAEETQKTKS